jgi:thiosulfate/3-mercaptopyruvate sulfurtransferase
MARKGKRAMGEYAHPEILVSAAWVAEHLSDPKVRIVEVDVDSSS